MTDTDRQALEERVDRLERAIVQLGAAHALMSGSRSLGACTDLYAIETAIKARTSG